MDELNNLYLDLKYEQENPNEEWFDEEQDFYETRLLFCGYLEALLYDYFSDCVDSGEDMSQDNLLLVYFTWLAFTAESLNQTLPEFEEAYSIDTVVESEKFAKQILDTKDVERPMSFERARNIARNETNILVNRINHEARKRAFKYHSWKSVGDKRVRCTHEIANGQKQLIDEPFKVGDSLLMYPGDRSLGARPEEIVNCRCKETFSN